MTDKAVVISWDAIKEVGITMKDKDGDCSIIAHKIPENCAVVFIEIDEWNTARRQAKV